jgi:nondiscriminating glutamyl-tRNA synthetase
VRKEGWGVGSILKADVRVRFAPSPTGHLHVGGARTALFNWLFARHQGGVFILRVEDTDPSRNRPEYVKAIYDGLAWLGLDWDEGPDRGGPYAPYLQSQRSTSHLAVARELLQRGLAYECFCHQDVTDDSENDDESDDRSNENVVARVYSRDEDKNVAARVSRPRENTCQCQSLAAEEKEARRAVSPGAIRFRVPRKSDFVVDDLIRGKVTFPPEMIEDFVLVTGDGRSLYNLAATVDDHEMAITHVIRGEEHLANTPKQQLIYQAMHWKPPLFAHIPIILNTQRRKLSKRDGATALNEFQAMGYLPEAVVNFLALLGWSPGGNRELMRRDELIALFDLDRVVKHPAIFDTAKLGWLNKEYIKTMSVTELASLMAAVIHNNVAARVYSRADDAPPLAREYLEKVAALFHDRIKTVAEVFELGSYFFTPGVVEPSEEALSKYCSTPEAVKSLREVRAALAAAAEFDTGGVERAIRDLAGSKGVKASDFIHPLRVAVTGQSVSPGIFEVCSILGREVVLKRVDALIHFLEAAGVPATKVAP